MKILLRGININMVNMLYLLVRMAMLVRTVMLVRRIILARIVMLIRIVMQLLPARASEQGNVIGLVSVYIYVVKKNCN